MISIIGPIAIYLSFTLIFLAFIMQWRFRDRNVKMRSLIDRFNLIGAILLWISFALIMYIYLIRDYQFLLVFNNADNSMTWIELISASWVTRQGVMILWAAQIATISVFVASKLRKYPDNPILDRILSILFFKNMLIAMFVVTTRPAPFATRDVITTNGQGMTPSLLSGWAVIHPPIAFMAYSSFVVPFAIGLALMTLNPAKIPVPRIVHWLTDLFMYLGWGFTTILLLAGSIWAYEENWSGFWAWDPVEMAAMVLWTVGVIYFHAKAHVAENHALRSLTATLGWLGVTFAAFVVRSGLLDGFHGYLDAGARIRGMVFGILFIGTALSIFYGVYKSKAEIFPQKVFAFSERKDKFSFVTLWILILLTVGNAVGIIMMILHAIATGETVIPYFYFYVVNLSLLFALAVMLPLSELKNNKIPIKTKLIIFAVVLALSFSFYGYVYYVVTTGILLILYIMVAILGAVFVVFAFHTFELAFKKRNFKKFGIALTHLAIILMILAYFSADFHVNVVSGIHMVPGEEVEIPEFGVSLLATRYLDNPNINITVFEDGKVIGYLIIQQGLYGMSFEPWNRGDWIVTPLYDYFAHLVEISYYGIINPYQPFIIDFHRVPMANTFRAAFWFFSTVMVVGVISLIKRKPEEIIEVNSITNENLDKVVS
jgi:cytochrome c biogenesis factor